jgi:hypothetical protein
MMNEAFDLLEEAIYPDFELYRTISAIVEQKLGKKSPKVKFRFSPYDCIAQLSHMCKNGKIDLIFTENLNIFPFKGLRVAREVEYDMRRYKVVKIEDILNSLSNSGPVDSSENRSLNSDDETEDTIQSAKPYRKWTFDDFIDHCFMRISPYFDKGVFDDLTRYLEPFFLHKF